LVPGGLGLERAELMVDAGLTQPLLPLRREYVGALGVATTMMQIYV